MHCTARCVLCCRAWCCALHCTVCAVLHCTVCVVPSEPATHCLTVRAEEVLQFSASSLPMGSQQWNSCNAPPHCLWAVGGGIPVMHCHTVCAVDVGRDRAVAPEGGVPRGTQRTYALYCFVFDSQLPVTEESCSCAHLRVTTPTMHCHTACGQCALELLFCTATLPTGSGRWISCGQWVVELLQRLGQWAVGLLQCTATLLGGSGQWTSCHELPHRLGAVGSGTPTAHCQLPAGSGQWNSCNSPPHCLGVVGNGTPAEGHSLRRACGGQQPPTAWATGLVGWGVLPIRWS